MVDNKFDSKKDMLATKQDTNDIRQDMIRLEVKIAESKSDMIKWFVAFFITLSLMIIGLYLKK